MLGKIAAKELNKEMNRGGFTSSGLLLQAVWGYKDAPYKSREYALKIVHNFIDEHVKTGKLTLGYDGSFYDVNK